MARGWESKAIEEQQAEAGRAAERVAFTPFTLEALAQQQRLESLRLIQSQLRERLQRTNAEAQRNWLASALQQLEDEMTQLVAQATNEG